MELNIFSMMKERFRFPKDYEVKLFESFSGMGCQRMAFDRIGVKYKSVGVSEIDKYALIAYEAIHGDCHNYGSITEIKGEQLPEIDVFTYSFPCTDLSKAGKQKGLGNTRSGLVYEVLRILAELKDIQNLPKVLIMENVVDLVQSKFIREFNEIQLELEQLGYSNYTETLNAKNYGVAQNRDRVFMVSILGDYYYEFPRPFPLEKRLKDYLESDVDERYYLKPNVLEHMKMTNFRSMSIDAVLEEDGVCNTILTMGGGNREPRVKVVGSLKPDKEVQDRVRILGIDGLSQGLRATDYKDPPKIHEPLRIKEATEKGYAEAYDGDSINLAHPNSKTRRGRVGNQIAQTLVTNDQQGVVVKADGNEKYINDRLSEFKEENGYMPEYFNPYNKQEITDVSPTITTMCDRWQSSATVAINQNYRIRKLTPRETGRLMGMNDEQIDKQLSAVSNSQAYKQHGNGIVVDVFASIVRKLIEEETHGRTNQTTI